MPDANAPSASPVIGRIEIKNYDRMGQLVKTWATGKDHLHLNDGVDYTHRPSSMAEMKSQMQSAGVVPSIPPEYMRRALVFVQSDDHTYYVRLPPKDLMDQSEGEISHPPPGWQYELPDFYSTLAFNGAPATILDKMKFHDSRIGDYTVSNCK